jgi:excisionase family DNA binding protein
VPSSKKLFKLSEAAEFLGLSKATLYKLTMTRQIPFIKLGSRTMFSEERLHTWIKAREHIPHDLLSAETRRRKTVSTRGMTSVETSG